ncbi:hypothetical protein [Enterococcus hulanensis]|uniref:hypothetical protein n=1 Tax=Enterococcus hulanensis TaxID=2559929 RepID=UPI0010F8331A|nr:hypothetical protein [Enterococcus hulanensis]
MRVIYPPLVEQAYRFAVSQYIDVSKDEVYRMMVRDGMLTETGNPTKTAMDQGIFSEFNLEHKTLKEFKKEYPVFKHYPAKEFTQQDGIWYVSQKIIEDIQVILDREKVGEDTLIQIEVYFKFRDYDDPHKSIAQLKGSYHPFYTPYDDSMFPIIDGEITIPKSVISDIIRRYEEGELEARESLVEGYRQILVKMEEQTDE